VRAQNEDHHHGETLLVAHYRDGVNPIFLTQRPLPPWFLESDAGSLWNEGSKNKPPAQTTSTKAAEATPASTSAASSATPRRPPPPRRQRPHPERRPILVTQPTTPGEMGKRVMPSKEISLTRILPLARIPITTPTPKPSTTSSATTSARSSATSPTRPERQHGGEKPTRRVTRLAFLRLRPHRRCRESLSDELARDDTKAQRSTRLCKLPTLIGRRRGSLCAQNSLVPASPVPSLSPLSVL